MHSTADLPHLQSRTLRSPFSQQLRITLNLSLLTSSQGTLILLQANFEWRGVVASRKYSCMRRSYNCRVWSSKGAKPVAVLHMTRVGDLLSLFFLFSFVYQKPAERSYRKSSHHSYILSYNHERAQIIIIIKTLRHAHATIQYSSPTHVQYSIVA